MRPVAVFFSGWRGLGRFWGLIVCLLAGGGGVLGLLGPPSDAPPRPAAPHAGVKPLQPVAVRGPPAERMAAKPAAKPAAMPEDRPGRDTPGPIKDPDPALLEPDPRSPHDELPRIAADGRPPMRHYAAGFDPSSIRPRIGLVIAGIGLGLADSRKAIADLPAEVSLMVSPYAVNVEPVLSAARLAGHEYLVSIPMEPLGFPLNDPGPRALMTNLSPEQNQIRLHWVMSRLRGYVGATAVLGALRGERLTDLAEQMDPIYAELGHRGLIYVAAPSEAAPLPGVWSRNIDLVIDEPDAAADIDARLSALETLARDRGAALGLVTAPRPVTVDRVAAWATGLLNRGLALAPASALMLPPAADKEAP